MSKTKRPAPDGQGTYSELGEDAVFESIGIVDAGDTRYARVANGRIMSMLNASSARVVCLGDSTENGWAGTDFEFYSQCANTTNPSHPKTFGYAVMQADPNFTAPDSSWTATVLGPYDEDTTAIGSAPIKRASYAATPTPSGLLESFAVSQGNRRALATELTIYYLETTTDAAPVFDVVIKNSSGTPIGPVPDADNPDNDMIDTYVGQDFFGSAGGIDVSGRVAAKSFKLTGTVTRELTVELSAFATIDRGGSAAADGIAIVYGATAGYGARVQNFAIASTTLKNDSADNTARGITTDSMVNRAEQFLYNTKNLFAAVEDFDVVGVTVTDGQEDWTIGTGAYKLEAISSTSGFKNINYDFTVTEEPIQIIVDAKAGETDVFTILSSLVFGSVFDPCVFNLTTGVVTNGDTITGTMRSLGDGWWRCIAETTPDIPQSVYLTIEDDAPAGEGLYIYKPLCQRVEVNDPAIWILGWSTNDSKVGISTVEAFKAEYAALIAEIRTLNPNAIIVISNDPAGLGNGFEFNPAYNEAARVVSANNGCTLLDVETMFSEIGLQLYSDSVHPNNLGYDSIAKELTSLFLLDYID